MKKRIIPNRYGEVIGSHSPKRSGILFVSSYPPRECGIATYSQDLVTALNSGFNDSMSLRICALESGENSHKYSREVKYILDTSNPNEFDRLVPIINTDKSIDIVFIQHEFGFFREQEQAFQIFIEKISKPVIISFHTVLPNPDQHLKAKVRSLTDACNSIIVLTNSSANLLTGTYGIQPDKISVISHGTHMVPHLGDKLLKMKYGFSGRRIMSTFGLLSAGKSIETTIEALPRMVQQYPEILFLVIGKTHPEVVKKEGEKYRNMLESKVKEYNLSENVVFINKYLALHDLLEYLHMTDIYLFTSNDPNQAVSGTFAYAMSCGCAVVSTPIPHALELLTGESGILIDFQSSEQLAEAVLRMLKDEGLRKRIVANSLRKIASTSWENSAKAHAMLFEKHESKIRKRPNPSVINMNHMVTNIYNVNTLLPRVIHK